MDDQAVAVRADPLAKLTRELRQGLRWRELLFLSVGDEVLFHVVVLRQPGPQLLGWLSEVPLERLSHPVEQDVRDEVEGLDAQVEEDRVHAVGLPLQTVPKAYGHRDARSDSKGARPHPRAQAT